MADDNGTTGTTTIEPVSIRTFSDIDLDAEVKRRSQIAQLQNQLIIQNNNITAATAQIALLEKTIGELNA